MDGGKSRCAQLILFDDMNTELCWVVDATRLPKEAKITVREREQGFSPLRRKITRLILDNKAEYAHA